MMLVKVVFKSLIQLSQPRVVNCHCNDFVADILFKPRIFTYFGENRKTDHSGLVNVEYDRAVSSVNSCQSGLR